MNGFFLRNCYLNCINQNDNEQYFRWKVHRGTECGANYIMVKTSVLVKCSPSQEKKQRISEGNKQQNIQFPKYKSLNQESIHFLHILI